MSFKRDESDPGPLGALQRRRVAELLASAIPEDEALLLRDGRFACSLCPHRPVCDTLETLLLHRAGRKHLDSLQRSFGRSRSPQAPLLARTRRIARSALLSSAPYSPCCRKKGSSSWLETIPKNPPNPEIIPGNPAHTEGAAEERKRDRKGNSGISKGNSGISQGNSGISKGNSRISKGNSRISQEGPSPEQLRILRHHLHLRSQGWLQDPSGNWVKDGNVEFDSDEEEPPPLPPA